MKGNRRVDTRPELALRSALHRRGLRFRKDVRLRTKQATMTVDVVFTRQRVAVFVDGCFWHCCPDHGNRPRVNTGYWGEKLRRNVERDRRNTAALQAENWHVVRLWEHTDVEEAAAIVMAAVVGDRSQHAADNRL
jgi:DNA mismatch endonuclease (patch repair protein)